MNTEWCNGFLFLGNQLALDFLNTRPVIDERPVELLADAPALASWLEAAGLIGPRDRSRLTRLWASAASAKAVGLLREYRERLRRAVRQMESGGPIPAVFVDELNQKLVRHPVVDQVVKSQAGHERRRRFLPASPEDVFAPLANATAELITGLDRSRIRQCPRCVLHFYDTSKKGRRIWCSMNLCGNRAKVAAFAARKQARADSNLGDHPRPANGDHLK